MLPRLGMVLLQGQQLRAAAAAAPAVLQALALCAPPGPPAASAAAAAQPQLARRAFTTSGSPALSAVYGGAGRFVAGAGVPSAGIAPMRLPRNVGVTIVPERCAYVIERFGRFHKVLGSGLHILIPGVDRIAYVFSLKELPIPIASQTAITKDNVTISIDGMLYVRVVDAFKASYGVDSALYAVSQLAQTTMRSELGRITLDKTFEEREALNAAIVRTINEASEAWGLECLRYEIKDINPPAGIVTAMALQAEAERRKRASILESEGQRQAKINVAEGEKQQVILAAEAEGQAICRRAEATAEGLRRVAAALEGQGAAAAQLRVAEAYVDAFGRLAKEGTTVLLPAAVDSPAAMISQAMSVYKAISGNSSGGGGGGAVDSSGSSARTVAGGGRSAGATPSTSGARVPAGAAAAAAAPLGSASTPIFTLRGP
ncbi:hypothetical protein Rsub_09723 [Raphidocelis subcapitata]|uniref:Band 7 domain-containing protein n=1 Tax=Raphidocelis subcapitata TaxID=307507 RepID=A0A2V0PKU5_9CHLO|nr:hypothetical protein Rsub_09723 [Raphidocelis subcapitata]|eukprot:GBF97665.1 hypothetical protein Rsub_09723 [Raphidocelis subcapitata]